MKNTLLVSFVTVLTILSILQITGVTALDGNLNINLNSVDLNGVTVTSSTTGSTNIAGFSGNTIPLKVVFTSNIDASDAKVKAWIGGYADDISASTDRIHLVNGSTYSELLSLKLPTNIDQQESATLYVRIETKTGWIEAPFNLTLQRDSYDINVLDVSVDKSVKAGDSLPVDVVLSNAGYERLDNVFVLVSIPELGIQKKAYLEDLTAQDNMEDNRADSGSARLSLKIPVNTPAGMYHLNVEAYNGDAVTSVKKTVNIVGAEDTSSVIAPIASKDIATGASITYDLVLVNSGDNIGVYEITPDKVDGLTITAQDSVVTIPAGSSKVVPITVTASSRDGIYNFAVSVNSQNQLVGKVALTANVVKKGFTSSSGGNLTVLTIVLAIIFVVLLVVLIVLLARKPKKEELEESYY